MKPVSVKILSVFILAIASFTNAFAQSDELAELGKTTFGKWLNHDMVFSAIKAQNQQNSGLSEADIIAQDKQWRAETSAASQPLIKRVLGNALSAYLSGVKGDAAGLYTEIFVMDNKGINVGQSDVTSDYWQGDEAKWQKTYLMGADAIHVSDVEMDESSQQFQAQVSLPVVDPANGEVIGAVTVGINVDAL